MTLEIKFLGAADTVTGSRTLVSWRDQRWLVDCGLFQGPKEIRDRNWNPFPLDAEELNGVILTHAHLDHSGYLPRLVKEGFRGSVFATSGTTDLARILLLDAAKLEEESARYANDSGYSNHRPALPLFDTEDAMRALSRFKPCPRHEWIALGAGLSLRFLRAGHIIGSSIVQLMFENGDGTPRLVTFSGDLGSGRSMTLRPAESVEATDVLVMESTYGDRLHPSGDALPELAKIVRRTHARGGVLVIPAFAVGRAQEVTYMLRLLEDAREIPVMPVILDSPMAVHAMDVFLKHTEDHVLDFTFSDDGTKSVPNFTPRMFSVASTPDESMLATMRDGPMVVISASGMLNGGRILHHLKRRLPDPRNTVMFTGYQAEGTKGRFLQDNSGKEAALRIHHSEVEIQAEVITFDYLSSHADYEETLRWIARFREKPEVVLINHGQPEAQAALASAIEDSFRIRAKTARDTPSVSFGAPSRKKIVNG